eukprot:m.80918 g.80918  ORF g.80918 m.80918 type:complete len:158 (-) comp50708_c0_seq1:8-481(-)
MDASEHAVPEIVIARADGPDLSASGLSARAGNASTSTTSIASGRLTTHSADLELHTDQLSDSPVISGERDQYQSKRWFEVSTSEIRASSLHNPRVRTPAERRIESRRPAQRELIGPITRTDFQRLQQDWENMQEVNFSYQSLGDSDQHADFVRMTRR